MPDWFLVVVAFDSVVLTFGLIATMGDLAKYLRAKKKEVYGHA